MRPGSILRTVPAVRVIIDFEGSDSTPWSGQIRFGEASAAPERFDGRLQLLRFLETAAEHVDDMTTTDGST